MIELWFSYSLFSFFWLLLSPDVQFATIYVAIMFNSFTNLQLFAYSCLHCLWYLGFSTQNLLVFFFKFSVIWHYMFSVCFIFNCHVLMLFTWFWNFEFIGHNKFGLICGALLSQSQEVSLYMVGGNLMTLP